MVFVSIGKIWDVLESGMFNLLIIVMSGSNRENYRVTVLSLLWQWWVSSAFRGCRSLGQWKIGQHMGSDSDYDSNSIRASLLYRWRVRIPILNTHTHTLSLSLSLSLSLFILFVNLKYGASSLQFNGSKFFLANFCKYIGV